MIKLFRLRHGLASLAVAASVSHASTIQSGTLPDLAQAQFTHPGYLEAASVDLLATLPPGMTTEATITRITPGGKVLLATGYTGNDRSAPARTLLGYVWSQGALSPIHSPEWPWVYDHPSLWNPGVPANHNEYGAGGSLDFSLTDMNDRGDVVGTCYAYAWGTVPFRIYFEESIGILWPANSGATPQAVNPGIASAAERYQRYVERWDLGRGISELRIDDASNCYAVVHAGCNDDWGDAWFDYLHDVVKWTDPSQPPTNLTNNAALFAAGTISQSSYSELHWVGSKGHLLVSNHRDATTSHRLMLPGSASWTTIPPVVGTTPGMVTDSGLVIGFGSQFPTVWPDGTRPALLSGYLPTSSAEGDFTHPRYSNVWLRRTSPQGDYYLPAVTSERTSYQHSPNARRISGGLFADGTRQRPLLRVPARLCVDHDRDGVIHSQSAAASAVELPPDSPFRFWINDDDDDGDDKRAAADDIPLPEGDSKRDSENTKVDGIRDLEDLFPVYFDIKQLLAVLPPGTNDIAYYLKHGDDALGVVFTSYTRAQSFDYLRGSPTALDTGFGPALTQKAGDATVVKITAAGVNISTASQPTASPAFFDRIKNNDGGILLVEASKATTQPLVLEVRKGSVVVAELSLPLKVDPVETMFRYANLRSFAHGTPIASNNQGPGYGSTTPTATPNDPFATAANRNNMVFVHGYNVNGEGARGSAATAFKRFYWSGSKAKFYAVLWRGDDGQGAGVAPAGSTPDYHRNVGHAWQQGPRFRNFLGTLQGDTAIMAHSLGNVVTQVALTRTRDPNNTAQLIPASKPATVKHYFAVDAAVPLEATSATDITSDSKSKLRHSWWAEYDSQERLWPSHWHELFAGTGDGREGLTWQNVFANLEIGTNFYSTGEEVLANPLNDGMPVLDPIFFGGLRAWVAQEKHKGGNGVAAGLFRSWTAGWVENKAWYVPIVPTPPIGSPQTRRRFASEAQDVAAPNGVPTSSLASEPFFQRFQSSEDGVFYPGYQGSRLHAPIGDANANDEARKLVTVAKCLGEAIPALSLPQGSNPATKFDRLSGNFDLNEPYDPSTGLGFKNGWPASRPNQNWLHSDCLDVSYIFHFKFYDRMKTDGGLQ